MSQRKYLERYLLDGRLEISNKGAKTSAIYYSLLVTAKENGLNPFEYLAWIFTNAPNMGKPGYVESFKNFLPGSKSIPENVFTPKAKED